MAHMYSLRRRLQRPARFSGIATAAGAALVGAGMVVFARYGSYSRVVWDRMTMGPCSADKLQKNQNFSVSKC